MENRETPSTQPPHGAAGTEYTHSGPEPVPAYYGDPAAERVALEEDAAVVDRSARTILRLSGRDPAGLLAAILTNKVPTEENRGVYGALLDQKGRVQTDLRVLKTGEDILADAEPEGAAAAGKILGRYAPFSRVKVEDLSGSETRWTALGLYGPRAGELVEALFGGAARLAEHETREVALGDGTLLLVGVSRPIPGYDLLGPEAAVSAAREMLVELGATLAGSEAYETARVEAAVPRFGSDITPENFPGETGAVGNMVSFEKGCYPGQETVARMHYRGQPNKRLHRLAVDGERPEAGTQILQNGKQAGRLTSVAPLPVGDTWLALGYLSRSTDLNLPLETAGQTVSPLPEDT
ncbi:MAG: folate-binding protein YgfZ [Rubrobacter sp.]|nr:folate-binding protein YgfZ [Rubrobacter sp.]